MMPSPLPDDQAESLIRLLRSRIRWLDPQRGSSADDDPDDLLQDILEAVMRKLPLFDPRRATLATFVLRIAETTIADRFRRRMADKRNPCRHPDRRTEDDRRPLDQHADPTGSAALRDLVLDLAEAIRRLPPEPQQLANDLKKWTPSEIAEREGVHPGTVYRRIVRLRERWQDSSLKNYFD